MATGTPLARPVRMARVRLLLAVALTPFGGCAEGERSGEAGRDRLLVMAAADLQDALPAIAERYVSAGGARPQLVFGATGNLAAQIENGAPADIFFAANEGFVDRLAEGGHLEAQSRRVYALGRLGVAWAEGVAAPASLEELADPRFRTVAIANPEHAPYGMAAREALRGAGVWERLQGRLVYGENVAQSWQFVRTGNADAALVARALLVAPTPRPHLDVPDSLHPPLRQAAAVLRGSRRPEEARRFLDFATGPEGTAVLRRFGFSLPPR